MPPLTPFCTTLTVHPSRASPSGKDVFTSQSLWVPYGARGVFGGQVIAQSLVAAGRTISPPLGLHSQHCYFLLPALASPAIEYHVDRIRDGRSYSNRLVKAVQNGKVIFVLAASYALPPVALPEVRGTTPFSFTPSLRGGEEQPLGEGVGVGSGRKDKEEEEGKRPAISHSLRFAVDSSDNPPDKSDAPAPAQTQGQAVPYNPPSNGQHGWGENEVHSHAVPRFAERYHLPFPADVLPPEECPSEEQRWEAFLLAKGDEVSEKRRKLIEEYIRERKESPVAISAARRRGGSSANDGFFSSSVRMIWIRAKLSHGERPDTELSKAMIAYMTDFQYIGTAAQSVGLTWTSQPRLGMLASLDHSTHFYPFPEGFSPGEPLLHVMQSVAADVASGRGLVRGALYTREGVLVGSTMQEGVVRASFAKKGGEGEDKGEKRAGAKL